MYCVLGRQPPPEPSYKIENEPKIEELQAKLLSAYFHFTVGTYPMTRGTGVVWRNAGVSKRVNTLWVPQA